MEQILLVFHIVFCLTLIGLVLLQRGKGAGMGASFGSGASQTVFGSRGHGGFLVKLTITIAALFFATSISLTYVAVKQSKQNHEDSFLTQVEQLSKAEKAEKQEKQIVVQKQAEQVKTDQAVQKVAPVSAKQIATVKTKAAAKHKLASASKKTKNIKNIKNIKKAVQKN